MTNPDKTHITIVMDRSGSMNSVRTDAEGAVNHFLTEQKAQPGECTLYFVDFDGDDPQNVVYAGPLADAPEYTLVPRGNTPLLQASGLAIAHTGEMLAALAEDQRPGKVIVVIQTDGQENTPVDWTWESLTAKIKEQTEVYGWQFVFLGMGPDTFKQGERLGIQNVVRTSANNGATHDSTHSVMSAYASSYRGGQSADMSAMRGMHVNSAGKVFNEAGEEVDPKTGDVVTHASA